MKKLTNKLRKVQSGYFRRKHRSNTVAKLNTDLPRLIVTRSNKHMLGQIVQDGVTLLGANDHKISEGTKTQRAYALGELLGKELLGKKISKVVFDRNGYLYHGRVKSLCEGVRSAGVTV